MKAIKITSDAKVEVINIAQPFYKALQTEVGGYIEIVRPKGLEYPLCMVIDEEGCLKRKPINGFGSYIYGYHEHGNPIVGDVVIMKEVETNDGRDLECLGDSEISELLDLIAKGEALWINIQ